MSGDFCYKKCLGQDQPRNCDMKEMARVWSRTAMDPSGWAECWPFQPPPPPPYFLACLDKACERCAYTRGCYLLAFLFCCLEVFFLSTFLASHCVSYWTGLSEEERWFVGSKLLTQVGLETLLVKAQSLIGKCTFWDRTDDNSAGSGWSSSQQTHLSLSVHGACACSCATVATVEYETCTAVVGLHHDSNLTRSVDYATIPSEMLHAACTGPVNEWTQSIWTCWKNDRSGNENRL